MAFHVRPRPRLGFDEDTTMNERSRAGWTMTVERYTCFKFLHQSVRIATTTMHCGSFLGQLFCTDETSPTSIMRPCLASCIRKKRSCIPPRHGNTRYVTLCYSRWRRGGVDATVRLRHIYRSSPCIQPRGCIASFLDTSTGDGIVHELWIDM
jgi:hypothetical protein